MCNGLHVRPRKKKRKESTPTTHHRANRQEEGVDEYLQKLFSLHVIQRKKKERKKEREHLQQ